MVNEIYEYTVDKKSEGKYKLARFLMVALYVLFMLALFVVVYVTRLIPAYALAPMLLWILILFTWRYVSIEYKYTVDAGMLKLFIVYGGKKQKLKAEFHIKEAVAFFPISGNEDAVRNFDPKLTYNFLSSARSPKDAYAFLTEADGRRVAALIEAPPPSKKAVLYYAGDEVREEKYLHPDM